MMKLDIDLLLKYWKMLFADFLKQFEAGFTPNPDILCNREIKFNVLLEKAKMLGGEFLATGHYCQIMRDKGLSHLAKGKDPGKDQSYFLHAVKSEALNHVLFPIGHLLKSEVRTFARSHGLATSGKKDSTGICFIGERPFREFLSQYIPKKKGNFETLEGKIVGTHEGAVYYTIGQRKGMGIGGGGEAWFVADKDITRNVVHVVQGTRHPALYCDELIAVDLTWVVEPPSHFPFTCTSKVRYRQPDQHCTIRSMANGRAFVKFDVPQRAVTPGQSVVFYKDTFCLGGGIIQTAGPSYYTRELPLPEVVSS